MHSDKLPNSRSDLESMRLSDWKRCFREMVRQSFLLEFSTLKNEYLNFKWLCRSWISRKIDTAVNWNMWMIHCKEYVDRFRDEDFFSSWTLNFSLRMGLENEPCTASQITIIKLAEEIEQMTKIFCFILIEFIVTLATNSPLLPFIIKYYVFGFGDNAFQEIPMWLINHTLLLRGHVTNFGRRNRRNDKLFSLYFDLINWIWAEISPLRVSEIKYFIPWDSP